MDGLMRYGPVAKLIAYAVVDQYVGFNGHAQGKGDGRNARQRQGGLQHGQYSQQQQYVESQANRREHAHQVVVQNDEDRDGDEAVQGGVEALLDVVGAQARAYGAFFNDLHGSSKRAGTQQQRRVGRFLGCHAAADLYLPARNFAADDRSGNDFALALFEQHNGHALVDVVARDVTEYA